MDRFCCLLRGNTHLILASVRAFLRLGSHRCVFKARLCKIAFYSVVSFETESPHLYAVNLKYFCHPVSMEKIPASYS